MRQLTPLLLVLSVLLSATACNKSKASAELGTDGQSRVESESALLTKDSEVLLAPDATSDEDSDEAVSSENGSTSSGSSPRADAAPGARPESGPRNRSGDETRDRSEQQRGREQSEQDRSPRQRQGAPERIQGDPPPASFVGEYRGVVTEQAKERYAERMRSGQGAPERIAEAVEQAVNRFEGSTLILHANGQMEVKSAGNDGVEMTGTWSQEDGSVQLNITRVSSVVDGRREVRDVQREPGMSTRTVWNAARSALIPVGRGMFIGEYRKVK